MGDIKSAWEIAQAKLENIGEATTEERLRWKYQTKGPITGTPTAQQDLIYIGSTDHRLYALLA